MKVIKFISRILYVIIIFYILIFGIIGISDSLILTCVVSVYGIGMFFYDINSVYEKNLKNIIYLSNIINDFNYSSLKNIKKIYLADNSHFKIILKKEDKFPLNYNINCLPKTQEQLEILDTELFIK